MPQKELKKKVDPLIYFYPELLQNQPRTNRLYRAIIWMSH